MDKIILIALCLISWGIAGLILWRVGERKTIPSQEFPEFLGERGDLNVGHSPDSDVETPRWEFLPRDDRKEEFQAIVCGQFKKAVKSDNRRSPKERERIEEEASLVTAEYDGHLRAGQRTAFNKMKRKRY